MEHEIQSIDPKTAAKAVGITFLFLGIILIVAVFLLNWFRPESISQPGLPRILLQPVIFAVVGYVFARFFCVIYNRVAGRWGGIRFNLAEIHSPLNPKWKP